MRHESLPASGSERGAKHTPKKALLCTDQGTAGTGGSPTGLARWEGGGLGEAGASGRPPEEVHRIAC